MPCIVGDTTIKIRDLTNSMSILHSTAAEHAHAAMNVWTPIAYSESCSLHDTIRYDTRCYINVRSKANMSQLNLPHGIDN